MLIFDYFAFNLCVAGVFCAIVSHPADSVVSVLNKEKGSTAAQVLKKLGPMGEHLPTCVNIKADTVNFFWKQLLLLQQFHL